MLINKKNKYFIMEKGISSVIATLLLLVITIGLTSLVAGYLFGYFRTSTSKVIEVTDAGCVAGASGYYYFTIKNMDTANNISQTELSVRRADGTVFSVASCSPNPIPPAASSNCQTTTTSISAGSFATIKIIGPSNSQERTVAC